MLCMTHMNTAEQRRHRELGFSTRCLHVGQGPDPATGAAAPPIYQTSSFEFPDAETAAARYALEDE